MRSGLSRVEIGGTHDEMQRRLDVDWDFVSGGSGRGAQRQVESMALAVIGRRGTVRPSRSRHGIGRVGSLTRARLPAEARNERVQAF